MKLTTSSKQKNKIHSLSKVANFKNILQSAAHQTIQQQESDEKYRELREQSNEYFKRNVRTISDVNLPTKCNIKSVEELITSKFGKQNTALNSINKNFNNNGKNHQKVQIPNLMWKTEQNEQTYSLIDSLSIRDPSNLGVSKSTHQLNIKMQNSKNPLEQIICKTNRQPTIADQYKYTAFQQKQQMVNKHQLQMIKSSNFKNAVAYKSKSYIELPGIRNLKARLLTERNNLQNSALSIDRFQIGHKIGRGRFGNVYKAQDKMTNFIVAIKIMKIQQIKQQNMQCQVTDEIKLQMYSQHPNVLKMYGYFKQKGNLYMILELAEQCLFKKLRNQIKFQEKDSAYYSKQVIEALKYLHSQSIIHRDLKPENIMLCSNVIKIGDFGWAAYSPQFKRQTFCGTLDYVPPQIINGEYYDERVDVWSLGVLIFQLIMGYPPFEADDVESQTFTKINKGKIQIPNTVSKDARKLILRILVSNPQTRLTLDEINSSFWIQKYEKQGRGVHQYIWNFWTKNN